MVNLIYAKCRPPDDRKIRLATVFALGLVDRVWRAERSALSRVTLSAFANSFASAFRQALMAIAALMWSSISV